MKWVLQLRGEQAAAQVGWPQNINTMHCSSRSRPGGHDGAHAVYARGCIGQEGTCVGCCNKQPVQVTVGQAAMHRGGLQHALDAVR